MWGRRHNWSLGLGQLARLARIERRLGAGHAEQADVVLVGYPGHFDMPAARRFAGGRPVVFNPLVSLHDTLVTDRGRFGEGSVASRVVAAIDRRAFRAATKVVADTRAHADFFSERFGLASDRLAVCFVGAEDRLFRPGWQPPSDFHALFVGKLIPLHGLETILEAARLIPHIPVRIVGSGQLDRVLDARPPNVHWTPWVEYVELPGLYQTAGCALGIFGVGEKTARVIPNKAFQALACACPLVTADTPAARELLRDGEHALLVPPGDAEGLAAAITRLATDTSLAQRLGAAGRARYEAESSEGVLGLRWRDILESVT